MIALDYTGCIIRWKPSPDNDLEGYNIYMKAGSTGEFKRMNKHLVKETEWRSPPLRHDMIYSFYITAVDTSDNESLPSPVQTFQLLDASIDPNIITIKRHHTMILSSNQATSELISSQDFLTRFTLGGDV